jgi:cell wall-associated NlpC family hydrolase
MFTACKPTSSIITSKEVAVKKGIYSEPVLEKNINIKKKNNEKDFVATQATPSENQKQASKIYDQNESDILINNEDSNYLIEQIINSASDNLGVNYLAGGTTSKGYDCSGLLFSTFKKFDITLPRSSHEMAKAGIQIDQGKAKKGDLIFFINRGQHRINHVGMIVEVNGDEIKFIHSSTQGGVIISSLKESYYERTFKQINRIIE